MATAIFLYEAEEDLLGIWQFIAEDNDEAADRFVDTLYAKCQLLAMNPRLGPLRTDIAPELRYFPVGNYLILFREHSEGIEVVRVLHGARNLTAALFPQD